MSSRHARSIVGGDSGAGVCTHTANTKGQADHAVGHRAREKGIVHQARYAMHVISTIQMTTAQAAATASSGGAALSSCRRRGREQAFRWQIPAHHPDRDTSSVRTLTEARPRVCAITPSDDATKPKAALTASDDGNRSNNDILLRSPDCCSLQFRIFAGGHPSIEPPRQHHGRPAVCARRRRRRRRVAAGVEVVRSKLQRVGEGR